MEKLKISLLYFILWIIGLSAAASDFELYDQEGFVDLIYESDIKSSSCQDFPYEIINRATSMKTKRCIFVYLHPNHCVSQINQVKFEAGDYPSIPYIPNEMDSFRPCEDISKNNKFKDQRVKLFEEKNNHGYVTPIEDYLLTTANCRTIPEFYRNKAHFVKTPICIKFYSHPDCQGWEHPFDNQTPSLVPVLKPGISSYKPCNPEDILKEIKLQAKAIRFQVTQNITEVENQAKTINLQLGSKTTFINNGSRTLTQKYNAEENFLEKMEIKRSSAAVSKINDFSTPASTKIEISPKIPQRIKEKILLQLPSAYQWQNGGKDSSSLSPSYLVKTTKKFAVIQDTVPVPPCTIYEVESLVKTTKDYPLHYTLTFEVTGDYDDGPSLTSQEIKEKLRSEFGNEDVRLKGLDSHTVMMTLENTITMDLALETVFNGQNTPIEECNANSNGKYL